MFTEMWKVFLICLLSATYLSGAMDHPRTIKIVSVFSEDKYHLTAAFNQAIAIYNKEQSELLLQGININDTHQNLLKRSNQLCLALKTGVVAVVGDLEPFHGDYSQSICDLLEIPYIGIRWDATSSADSLVLNLFPHAAAFAKAFTDIVKYWGWQRFTILYQRSEDLLKFQDLLKLIPRPVVSIRRIRGFDHREILRELRSNGENRIIVDCSAETVMRLLKQAQQLQLLTSNFQYLLTTLNIHTVDLTTFVYDDAKITFFQLIDSKANYIQMLNETNLLRNLTTEEALVHDAVNLVSRTFMEKEFLDVEAYPVDCETGETWPQGTEAYNAFSSSVFDGLTGKISFGAQGARSSFLLRIMQATEDGPFEVGQWMSNQSLQMGPGHLGVANAFRGRNLRAITVLEPPYVMNKSDWETRTGNDRYEGFAVDLFDKITKRLGMEYTLEDKGKITHGVYDATTGKWNGLINELINRRADIAVGGVTINHDRENVVDFTKPFMHLGIGILFKKPAKQDPDLFSFLHPFSGAVWLYMIITFLAISFIIFILARFTPYEWYNPHPCDEHSNTVENQFTIGNSLWFTVGSLMQQGSDVAPRSISTRVIAGSWWFFTLIMIASYTANLAAFLTVEQTDQPIKTVEDLANQAEIKYGCYDGGTTYDFFKATKHPTYSKMWSFMNTDKSNFHKEGKSGTAMVKKGKYAYLMESPSIEYTVNQNCDLVRVGGLLDSKGFGFVTPQNSPYRDMISKEILRMQENSELQVLKDKWWKGKSQAICDQGSSDPLDLGLANLGGVFVVLIAGIGTGFICAVLEFSWEIHKLARVNHKAFRDQFAVSFMDAMLLRSTKEHRQRKKITKPICERTSPTFSWILKVSTGAVRRRSNRVHGILLALVCIAWPSP